MNAPYRFGRFELNPTTRRLHADGQPVALGARALDVLLALIERRERLVGKDELLELVWPNLVVEENSLQVQVSTLRKTLGADAIATIPGRGYRFTLELPPADKAASPAEAPRHNLPQALTSFIGHEDDLREYVALLEQTRLLTLTGIGGCGKTRLALKLAEVVLPSFADGVWFVDLAPLSDAERVPLTVATTLGIREQADPPRIDALCKHLAARRTLLVLDNCEHLAAACADLTQRLLGAAPGVRVLATSREGLNVPGERTVTVRSLALPAIGSEHDLPSLESCEAVRLFVERARLAATRFSLDATTAPAVAEICRRLDGIPLAIELAAARVKVLSVEEIRARLNDRFRLLTGRGRTPALARQQTLLAAIQWSYDHLAPDEQRLLRLLSVFAGGWTLAAAVRVIGEQADEYEVLDLLTLLVDRSLVTIEPSGGGATRYAMLETVRQYAQERLNQSGEHDAARLRHLEFFVALAEEADSGLSGRKQGEWLARLKVELENLLQALACDSPRGATEFRLRLAAALGRAWIPLGSVELGRRVTLNALEDAGAAAHHAVWANVCYHAGCLSRSVGRFDDAKAYVAKALAIARELGDDHLAVRALTMLSVISIGLGSVASAQAHAQDALALARDLKDKALLVRTLNAFGEVYRWAGDLEAAQPLYDESLALGREEGDLAQIAILSLNVARVLIAKGAAAQARDRVREAFKIAEGIGSKWAAQDALDVTAALGSVAGEWMFAARISGAAESHYQEAGSKRDSVDGAFLAPLTLRTREALGDAAYSAAFDAGHALSHEQAVAEALAWLGKSTD